MTTCSSVAVVCGGVGAARFLRGLIEVFEPANITAIINVADDTVLHGLSISPDIDTVIYTLADQIDPNRGWGLRDESWRAMESLASYGDGAWFSLGDRDLGTHLHRTGRLAQGRTLSQVTKEIAATHGVTVDIEPVSNDSIRTRVQLQDRSWLSFQEYFVGRKHDVDIVDVEFVGIEQASPTQATTDALQRADLVVLAPSNPIVSLGPVLEVPGVKEILLNREHPTIAISPIIGGRALKGPAARILQELGHQPTALGVATLYRDLISGFVLDDADATSAAAVRRLGITPSITNTIMSRPSGGPLLASHVLSLSTTLTRARR